MVSNIEIFDKLLALLRALREECVYLEFFLKCFRDFWLAGSPFVVEGIDRINGKK